MLKDWTDDWLEEVEDALLSEEQKKSYYQSVYSGWIVPRPRDIVNQGHRPVMSGLTGKE